MKNTKQHWTTVTKEFNKQPQCLCKKTYVQIEEKIPRERRLHTGEKKNLKGGEEKQHTVQIEHNS